MGANPGPDDGGTDRLGDVVHCPGLKTGRFIADLAERGDENDRHGLGGRFFLEAPARLQAGQSGHHDIEQDEVGQLIGSELQGFFAVASEEQAIVLVQNLAQDLQVGRFIVDDEDLGSFVLCVQHVAYPSWR